MRLHDQARVTTTDKYLDHRLPSVVLVLPRLSNDSEIDDWIRQNVR